MTHILQNDRFEANIEKCDTKRIFADLAETGPVPYCVFVVVFFTY